MSVFFKKTGFFLAALFGLIIFFLFIRSIPSLEFSVSTKNLTYEESLKQFHFFGRRREIDYADYCRPLLYTHGHQVKKAIVLYHGYTNCPRQYEKLAKLFYDQGYNVYVPRIPYHGSADRVTKEIAGLTMKDLVEVCVSSVNIASGLGERVDVLGLSMGGVMAAWNAQFSDRVDTAVIIVPSFGWYFFPGVIAPLINAADFLPNIFFWWDPVQRDRRQSPFSMYHHFSSKGSGHILRIGLEVLRNAREFPPKAGRIIVLENELDMAVDHLRTLRIIRAWRSWGTNVSHYIFPASLKIEHDIIDPLQPYEKTDIVYQKILEMMGAMD